jgi:GTP-binding protein
MEAIEERRRIEGEDPEAARIELERRQLLEQEARIRVEELRAQQRAAWQARKDAGFDDDEEDWDDEDGPEVIYQR